MAILRLATLSSLAQATSRSLDSLCTCDSNCACVMITVALFNVPVVTDDDVDQCLFLEEGRYEYDAYVVC